MGKRSRDDSEDHQDVSPPAAKRHEIRTDDGQSAAARRQARSERKSKKSHNAKREKKQKMTPKIASTTEGAGNDSLAEGNDFVSLVEPEPAQRDTKSTKRKDKSSKKSDPASNTDQRTSETPAKKPKESIRFICFVGNLPYSCTVEQIKHHFRKIEPTSVRLSTDKATGKPKGFAFIEFDDYSKMKTCLKVYHHSIFDPERTAKLPESAFDEHGLAKEMPETYGRRPTGRKINVELTAGGGGQGVGRKQKITQKNEKLWEERERRKKADIKQQKAKEKKNKEKSDANATVIGADAVHPDRLRQVHRE